MFTSKLGMMLATFAVGAMTLVSAATTSADTQTKREQAPQIVHLDVRQAGNSIHARGVIYVPENTRVTIKYLTTVSRSWQDRSYAAAQPRGRNVNFEWNSGNYNPREWNGKTFSLTLMASSSAGAVTKSDSVVFRQMR